MLHVFLSGPKHNGGEFENKIKMNEISIKERTAFFLIKCNKKYGWLQYQFLFKVGDEVAIGEFPERAATLGTANRP